MYIKAEVFDGSGNNELSLTSHKKASSSEKLNYEKFLREAYFFKIKIAKGLSCSFSASQSLNGSVYTAKNLQ